jgi:hypothetical protein
MRYSKNGSYPQPQMGDNLGGWVMVPDPPSVPEGKQLAWLNYEWIIRDPKPEDRDGFQWNWIHDEKAWIEFPLPGTGQMSGSAEGSATVDLELGE